MGPAECAWAVVQAIGEMEREAMGLGLACKVVEIEAGAYAGTAQSALLAIAGADEGLERFAAAWKGTVQWTGAQSLPSGAQTQELVCRHRSAGASRGIDLPVD